MHVICSSVIIFGIHDAQVHSWIDHILCPCSSSHLVSNACTLQSGNKLSDHLPLLFSLHINCAAVPPSRTPFLLLPPPLLALSGLRCLMLMLRNIVTISASVFLNFL